ncbi:MAG: outer membrane protein transport protein [Bdellovibrionales bacterium]|nr:outer membrane protein transport protein [Bdellovibrionales bacterium]
MKKLFFIISLCSIMSYGSGYEKTVLWGAKYSGTAGVGSPGIKGSDAIYYNPAGLVNSAEMGEFAFNLSNSTSTFKGPIVPNSTVYMAGPSVSAFTNAEKQETSATANSLIPGVTYSMKLSDSLSYGIGYYAVGGTRANYENIDFAPRSFKAKVGSEITISEFAAGIGYKMSEALRLGLALRYTMIDANFSSVSYTTSSSRVGAITNMEVKDLKTATLDSVRLGAQYDLSEDVKLGFMIRTETKMDGTGKASGTSNAYVSASNAVVNIPISEVDAKVETVLPMAIGLGTEMKLSDAWKFFGEYVFTQYSRIDKVSISGTISVAGTPKSLEDIQQKWKDQHVIKLAGEYSGISWPVRFGYIWTSQVTDAEYARASFTPRGVAATYNLGKG